MSFGGYKFAGFRVDNSQYANSTYRCLAIHAARVRAFLKASNEANSTNPPWFVDPDKQSGELNVDVSTGAITQATSDGVIHEFKVDGAIKAYSSYFKYSSGDLNGYYYILTMVDYAIGTGDSGHIILPKASCLQRYSDSYISSGSYYFYGPRKASCFHCFSLDPFPSDLNPGNFVLSGLRSTRLCSVGTNSMHNSSRSYESGGYVNYSTIVSMFGYAVKDTDIIVLSGSRGLSSTNPFSSSNGGHINVLSLNGFLDLYVPGDDYKLLQYDARNTSVGNSNYSSVYDETEVPTNAQRGAVDQVLDPQSGEPLIDVQSAHRLQLFVLPDLRTYYSPSGAQSTPYCGLQACIYDVAYSTGTTPYSTPFSNTTQFIKGGTNPELVCMSSTTWSISNTIYSTTVDGNLLYTNTVSASGGGTMIYPEQTTLNTGGGWYKGNYNFFIGWDSGNPDIKSDVAWPEYNAVIPAQTVYSTMSY